MKVWTRQHPDVLKTLLETGTYTCKSEYISMKMEEYSDYYKNLYSWYMKRADKIVAKPDHVEYPIWVSIDEDVQLQLVDHSVIIELDIDEEHVVVTDMEKWGYVVNYFYLPRTHEDLQKHYKELERFGIHDETSITMGPNGNFYPLLKRKITDSWERLFEDYTLSDIRQGTVWELKKEWITNVIEGKHE